MHKDVMKLVDLVGLHVEPTSGTPLVILREHDAPHRALPIFIGGAEAASIAVALSGQRPPRPFSHDLMAEIVNTLGAQVDMIEVTEIRDGAFFAELAITGPGGERRLDARPSDCIALAVRMGIPLYASDKVLGEAGSALPEQPDQAAIDRAVSEFRDYLDQLEPDALAAALAEKPAAQVEQAAEPEQRVTDGEHEQPAPETDPDTDPDTVDPG
ncbi:MAG TPA: bifunctional nuclease family protein [Pseudonocardia sp.]|jgi:bifunctional DNase/RNase|nr:bifunctional nuclease family protein [Pseudonocardia sp.]